MNRVMPMARRQYASCFAVNRTGTAYPAGIQPSGQDDLLLWLFRVCRAPMFVLYRILKEQI